MVCDFFYLLLLFVANLSPSSSPEEIELKGLSFLPDLYNILSGGPIVINSFEKKRKEKTVGSLASNLTSEQFQLRRLLAIRKCVELLKGFYSVFYCFNMRIIIIFRIYILMLIRNFILSLQMMTMRVFNLILLTLRSPIFTLLMIRWKHMSINLLKHILPDLV